MAIINSSKRVTRTVEGIVFTKNPYSGAWENLERGISIRACYTGNLCSKVSSYVINVRGSKQCTERSFTDAIKTAIKLVRK